MSTQAMTQKKLEFIRRIMDETSLDTLDSWYDMYEEARYVASLKSDEPKLKEFRANYEDSFGQWSRRMNNGTVI